MINIRSNREIELLIIAGNIVYQTHQYIKPFIKEGITTEEIDRKAHDFIISKDAIPSFKNFNGFPKSICTSVNQQVVHGIPGNYKLKNGDIISIDIGACYKGYHGDSAWTYPVGKISSEKEYLLNHTKESLYRGLSAIKPGNRIGDISNAIEEYATKYHLGIVRELVGHGVGSNLHESPDIPNYGKANSGPILKEGMILAVEPMLNLGSKEIYIDNDNWTIETADNSPSAHFEHTVVVTKDGYKILTGE
ncbi:MAG: type I methionyl aminopeptidase [Tenericutes bacterium]|nr:type I methionyl aminopeptidase [Mycoplasmatota bacterium]